MTIDMSQFYEVFFDEADELLAEAERLLLGIDMESPDDEELNAIFRAAHSIKGGAATFGFMDMTEITHVLENLLDKIRKHEMALTAEHVDAFLAAKDVLAMELNGHRNAAEVDQEQVADVKMVLKSLSDASGVVIAAHPVAVAPAPVAAPVPTALAKIEYSATAEVAQHEIPDGSSCFNIVMPEITERDVENLQEELGLLGLVVVSKQTNGRYVLSLTTDSSQADIVSICSFIVDADDLVITLASTATAVSPVVEVSVATTAPELAKTESKTESKATSGSGVEIHEEVGYGLFEEEGKEKVEEGYGFFAPFQPHPDAVVASLIGDDTVLTVANSGEPAVITAAAVEAATEAGSTAPGGVERRSPGRRESDKATSNTETSSIRVGVEKVDQLINLVGELVITQAMIEQRISHLDPVHHEALINSVGQLTRNTRDLQESVMSIRMMPMDFVFSRFPRMVRDLAAKLNKKVEFVTIGAATELDKGLIERIVDPLTHLVRNSVDHGIEIPANRRAAGKGEAGTLTLSAAHKGGSIVIEVTDDGAGLNRNKLLEKATKNGLAVSENMSDSEVFALIFAPGFSTAEVVTDVSGRGVGMDVVKRNITSMGGVVEIRSALGFGTTISIALPLTLAILDGMSVSLGKSIYVIPLNLIVETLQPRAEDIKTVTGEGRMVHVRGEYLPIIALHSLFNHATDITDPTKGVLVLIESDGKKSALFVDRLVGQQQVVIKSLETNFKKVPGISGATIMGDGGVALILDVSAIIQMGQNTNYLTGAPPFSNPNNQPLQNQRNA
ncbi:MAG: chemotaxis protein CheA [Methylotenera sp.]|nr:chemotaxis protein CheA [Methylotenera sp.]MDO9232730.1 chemotaxis protein CheA [Methylotenera sp.]MDO9389856.1 chemotaxis protein CheA [Methylotenera sp.]MDP2102454.1 chemotaxis protein CheA [Methylotenera sp.]MDP2281863.1 chemotaxis protein CheA [Methylotenera sp.]